MLSFKEFINENIKDASNQKRLGELLNPNKKENPVFDAVHHILTLHSQGVGSKPAFASAVEKFGENGKISGLPDDLGKRLHNHPDAYNNFKKIHGIPDNPTDLKFNHKASWVSDAIKTYTRSTPANQQNPKGLGNHLINHENNPNRDDNVDEKQLNDRRIREIGKSSLEHHGLELAVNEPKAKPVPRPTSPLNDNKIRKEIQGRLNDGHSYRMIAKDIPGVTHNHIAGAVRDGKLSRPGGSDV